MICKKCGREIKEGNNFCTNCGTKVVLEEKRDNNLHINNVDVKLNKKEKVGVVFIAIFVIIFMIYLLIRQGVIQIGGFYL